LAVVVIYYFSFVVGVFVLLDLCLVLFTLWAWEHIIFFCLFLISLIGWLVF